MAFTMDNFPGFRLDDPDLMALKVKESEPMDTKTIPYLANAEAWAQYNDELIYELDKKVRDWLIEMAENPAWRNKRMMRKFTCGMVFQAIMGYKHSGKGGEDNKISARLSKILSHYATRVQTSYYTAEKQSSKKAYTMPVDIKKKPPYSLRYRLEWLAEQGKLPTWHNMRMPDHLKAGQARNPKTQENMTRRSNEAKERLSGYQKKWREENPDRIASYRESYRQGEQPDRRDDN